MLTSIGTLRIRIRYTACSWGLVVGLLILPLHHKMLQEIEEKVEGLKKELASVQEEWRGEGGRLRVELERKEERLRKMESEARTVREELEEKERLLKKKEEVSGQWYSIQYHLLMYTQLITNQVQPSSCTIYVFVSYSSPCQLLQWHEHTCITFSNTSQ